MDLLKTVRVTSDFKVEVYQDGKRKFANILDYNSKASVIGFQVMKGSKMDRSMSDNDVIIETLKIFATSNREENLRDNSQKNQDFYKIIQDPWSDETVSKRHYGFDPYYLNNGCKIYIQWLNNNINKGSYEDDSTSDNEKNLIIWMPSGVKEDGNFKFMKTNTGLEYYSLDKTSFIYSGSLKDEIIINDAISIFKMQISKIHGDNNYNLELCSPDSKACSIIPYKSPVQSPTSVIFGPTSSTTTAQKIQLTLIGLPDILEIKAKQDLPDFTVHIGNQPVQNEGDNTDEFIDGEGLDEEYTEGEFQGSEETEVKFLLNSSLSELDESDTMINSDYPPLSTTAGGRSGDKQFQKSMTVNNNKVFNGEIPNDLLEKLDFCGLKLEKHAARQLNLLNVEFKKKFGQNIEMSGGYRTFKVQNDIFDWNYWETNKKARKKGTNGGVSAAKPGTSKHGWGLAIDTSNMGDKGNPKFDWLEANGPRFGWINPSWAKASGAGHEPWHREYIRDDAFKSDTIV